MIEKIERHKYYTDQERYEWCRKCRLSGKTVTEFARENNLSRSTLKDWMNAYKNLNGKFINVKTVAEEENNIINEGDVKANILTELQKREKCSHFSRFDHSIVVVEYRDIKITTSIELAERLLEKII